MIIRVQKYLKECEGCNMYHMGIECKVLEIFRAQECPCIKCLVKTMCTIACEKYNHLTRDIDEEYEDDECFKT